MPSARRSIAPAASPTPKASAKDSAAMSFVMLSDSQVASKPPPNTANTARKRDNALPVAGDSKRDEAQEVLSKRVESNQRLFELISARSDIDHPICSECTELLLSSMQGRLASTIKERDAYIGFLKELKSNAPTAEELMKAESDLATANTTEKTVFGELLALEKEKAELEDELVDLEAESRGLDHEEEVYWRSRNAFDLRFAKFRDARDALTAAHDHDARQLERLQRTNVYNDTFCVSHDGNFGTINGLRLGKLAPPNSPDWTEINAAWGSTALLLLTVAERLGFSFRGYIIRPIGSTSRIDRIDYPQATAHSSAASSTSSSRAPSAAASHAQQQPPQQPKVTTLELFSSGDVPIARQILHRRFNEAMVAFLDCLLQLGEFVERTDPRARNDGARTQRRASANDSGLRLPYNIEKDRIGGDSIKLGVGSDEHWTAACKYTLTCCKFLLAHASNVAGGRA